MASEIRQQFLTYVKSLNPLLKSPGGLVGVKVLSPGEEYGNKPQPPADAYNYALTILRTFMDDHGNLSLAAMEGAIRGYMYGVLQNFPGAKKGHFNAVFSFLHELAHCAAKAAHSAVIQEKWTL